MCGECRARPTRLLRAARGSWRRSLRPRAAAEDLAGGAELPRAAPRGCGRPGLLPLTRVPEWLSRRCGRGMPNPTPGLGRSEGTEARCPRRGGTWSGPAWTP